MRLRVSRAWFTPVAAVVGALIGIAIQLIAGARPTFAPVLSIVSGAILALAVPFWQALVVNRPKLSVEISSIRRAVSDLARIDVLEDSELKVLAPWREPGIPYFAEFEGARPDVGKRVFTLEEVRNLLVRSKQRLRELPAQIEERSKELERAKSINPETFTKFECDQLNRPLYVEADFDPDNKAQTLRIIQDAYQARLDVLEKRYADLQTNIPIAERKLESTQQDLTNTRSYFTVSVSLINSGRTNTAVKVPALLRVSIGEGNYIDIKLSLNDFENKSEIAASGTRIAVFSSTEVSSLPEEDRKLINTYWGQSVRARLFLEDIHGSVYSSNSISFAEGLYQKIIYDRLATEASRLA